MEEILKTIGLSKKFGKSYAVENLNMTINRGDIYGFIGRNGAGKTTLIRMVTGLANPNSGSIKLFGSDDLLKGRDRIGTIIENPGLFTNMTGLENLKAQSVGMGLNKSQNELEEFMALVGLNPKLTKKVKNYSLGMKQRLAIAISLIASPDLLILDEPTNGLDPEGIRSIRNLILKLNKERGITVLISSHILGELHKLATKYGIIDNGVLIDEFTAEDLDYKTRDAFEIIVKNEMIEKTENIIKNRNYEYVLNSEHGKFLIFSVIENTEEFIMELFENKIIPTSYHQLNADLEDYFLKVIGGKSNE